MTWVMFDESDRRTPAPPFCLLSLYGQQVCLQDYHEDCNLVLYFAQGTGCQACQQVLRGLAARLPDYQAEDAKILAIFPGPVSALADDPALTSLPFAILSDPGQEIRRQYQELMDESLVSAEDGMLFVLDRYNAPYAALIGDGLNTGSPDNDVNEDVLNWLEFIGIQCPE